MVIERNPVVVLDGKGSLHYRYGILGAWVCVFEFFTYLLSNVLYSAFLKKLKRCSLPFSTYCVIRDGQVRQVDFATLPLSCSKIFVLMIEMTIGLVGNL